MRSIKNVLILFAFMGSVQCFADISKVDLLFPTNIFLGASAFQKALGALQTEVSAGLMISSVQYIETTSLQYEVCSTVEVYGGDNIRTAATITGQIVGTQLPRGTFYQIQNVVRQLSNDPRACDKYLGSKAPKVGSP